jgi:hypothetical protein
MPALGELVGVENYNFPSPALACGKINPTPETVLTKLILGLV